LLKGFDQLDFIPSEKQQEEESQQIPQRNEPQGDK
jgi:hypothetical protein